MRVGVGKLDGLFVCGLFVLQVHQPNTMLLVVVVVV
jgi:hypothetical protein